MSDEHVNIDRDKPHGHPQIGARVRLLHAGRRHRSITCDRVGGNRTEAPSAAGSAFAMATRAAAVQLQELKHLIRLGLAAGDFAWGT